MEASPRTVPEIEKAHLPAPQEGKIDALSKAVFSFLQAKIQIARFGQISSKEPTGSEAGKERPKGPLKGADERP